jgi:alpha-tubulin suppressor-like RCC1 family protein
MNRQDFGSAGTGYKIYITGDNDYGQIANGKDDRETITTWQRADENFLKGAAIKSIACGYYHTFVITGTTNKILTERT